VSERAFRRGSNADWWFWIFIHTHHRWRRILREKEPSLDVELRRYLTNVGTHNEALWSHANERINRVDKWLVDRSDSE